MLSQDPLNKSIALLGRWEGGKVGYSMWNERSRAVTGHDEGPRHLPHHILQEAPEAPLTGTYSAHPKLHLFAVPLPRTTSRAPSLLPACRRRLPVRFAGRPDDAVLLLARKPFDAGDLPGLAGPGLELQLDFVNDIYSKVILGCE